MRESDLQKLHFHVQRQYVLVHPANHSHWSTDRQLTSHAHIYAHYTEPALHSTARNAWARNLHRAVGTSTRLMVCSYVAVERVLRREDNVAVSARSVPIAF